jgi:hypothetical protein
MEAVNSLDSAARDSPGVWAWNVEMVAAGTGEALAIKVALFAAGGRVEVSMITTMFPDERLVLILTCCHAALAVEALFALASIAAALAPSAKS